MKKLLLLVFIIVLSGCVSLDNIPRVEFDRFEYSRAGNVTSASIVATGARKEGDSIKIDHVSIIENWGPVLNFKLIIEGYKRKIKE